VQALVDGAIAFRDEKGHKVRSNVMVQKTFAYRIILIAHIAHS